MTAVFILSLGFNRDSLRDRCVVALVVTRLRVRRPTRLPHRDAPMPGSSFPIYGVKIPDGYARLGNVRLTKKADFNRVRAQVGTHSGSKATKLKPDIREGGLSHVSHCAPHRMRVGKIHGVRTREAFCGLAREQHSSDGMDSKNMSASVAGVRGLRSGKARYEATQEASRHKRLAGVRECKDRKHAPSVTPP